ncbi:MAG TPA: orotate phosphoribosyltransferase [Thermoplasmata archaeon]|jgi:orotate phosphoribosyltransferase|nr:orotate phosphoribosyltransferase [Thermoplasmata archaeon]
MVRPASPPTTADLVRTLIDAGAVRFGEFTLSSGETSDVYIDVKRAWPDPDRLALLARALVGRLGDEPRLAGMELGAVPLVVAVSLATGRPYAILRKAAKEHGTRQPFEGEIPKGERVLLIEDVTTTGGSSVRSVEIIRAAGGQVDRALAIVDREAGAAERLAAVGVRLEPLLTMAELRGGRA